MMLDQERSGVSYENSQRNHYRVSVGSGSPKILTWPSPCLKRFRQSKLSVKAQFHKCASMRMNEASRPARSAFVNTAALVWYVDSTSATDLGRSVKDTSMFII